MAESEPAFPVSDCAAFQYSGMNLRDWFAGQALIALPHLVSGMEWGPNEAARDAYCIADAMLAARKENEHGRV